MSLADELRHKQEVENLTARIQRTDAALEQAKHATDVMKGLLEQREKDVEALEIELASFRSPVHEIPAWQIERSTTPHRAILFGLCSDWHIGEVIDPGQMDGLNAFNYDIAQIRSGIYFDKLVELPKKYMGGRTYEGIALGMGGDGVSGSIHDELRETDQFSVLESTRKCRDLYRPGIKYLSENYNWVHLYFVPGNHGRDSKRPRYKGRAQHNADIHIAYLVKDMVADLGLPNVSVDITEGLSLDFRLYDVNFRLEHLDEARGGNGVMGIFAPLPRHVLRRQQQARGERALKQQMLNYGDQVRDLYEEEDKTPDIIAGGHWHQLVDARGQGFLVNGCLKGHDEYARGQGYKPERPQQGLWVVTPERGITTFETVHVDDRKTEGW